MNGLHILGVTLIAIPVLGLLAGMTAAMIGQLGLRAALAVWATTVLIVAMVVTGSSLAAGGLS